VIPAQLAGIIHSLKRPEPVSPGLHIPQNHHMKIPPSPNSISRAIVALLGCLSIAPASQAAIMNLGQTFSDGAVAPGGSPPWMIITTSNHPTGAVLLEFEATNLINHEFVSEWVLNLDPALDPSQLVFSTPQQTGSFVLPTIQTGTDQFKADGDGWFDIQFLFSTSNTDPDAVRFTAGDKLSYLVTLAGQPSGTLDEGSLHFLSAPGGGNGPFYSAAHIQATGYCCGGSAWIANVPEPGSTLLGGLGLLALLRRRRD
jgi:MYXO-CTERM domain-containing protein